MMSLNEKKINVVTQVPNELSLFLYSNIHLANIFYMFYLRIRTYVMNTFIYSETIPQEQ